jgi:antitoxin (DNA-binding transcriptional repressor) of toxin-antitoxin stability system
MVGSVIGLAVAPQVCLCTRVHTSFTTVGVRALRQQLAEAVRRAGNGERTIVTTGGRPIAQLGPLVEGAPVLEQLLASGSLVAPRRTSTWRPPPPVAIWSGVRIDRALRELRG